MSSGKRIGVGIIGGGLMGREVASAFARWCALADELPTPELVAVADPNPAARDWFRRIPTVRHLESDYRSWLSDPAIDVCYVAVPHHLHREIYAEVMTAGKDLLAEKPFGIDLEASRDIRRSAEETGRFVRCSSEFPFFPGAQAVISFIREGKLGRPLDLVSGFHHASDLDPDKPANWKRQSKTCGEIGVLGDLGMHTLHIPLRLGWVPGSVYAQLQKGYPERPSPEGPVSCDTWDNAQLHTWITAGDHDVPLRLEMRRLAPGETNTWFIRANGTEGAVSFSTKTPKTLWTHERNRSAGWERVDLGFSTAFKTITGGIFEPGFPDAIQQMWAAFLAERDGALGDRLGCVTVDEAVRSHEIFQAAIESAATGQAVKLDPDPRLS